MRTGAPTLSLVTVAQMKRTGKPETVSLTVNGPTRTNGQQTKPTPRAGSGAGATGRTKHMQEQKNNTKPKFTTNVYVHRTKLHVLKPRTRCLLGSGGNNRAQDICVLPIRFLVRLVIRHGLVAAVCVPISTRTDTKIGGRWRIINGKYSQTTEVAVTRPNTGTSILCSMENK